VLQSYDLHLTYRAHRAKHPERQPEQMQQQAADHDAAKRYATAARSTVAARLAAAAAAAEHAVADLSPIDQAYIAICLMAEAQG